MTTSTDWAEMTLAEMVLQLGRLSRENRALREEVESLRRSRT